MTRDTISQRSRLSILKSGVLSAGFSSSLFTSGSSIGIFPCVNSDQSKSSLGNTFNDTSGQRVMWMLSHDCILVRFNWFGPEQSVWCEKDQKQQENATMYHLLPLVQTKWTKPQMWKHPEIFVQEITREMPIIFEGLKDVHPKLSTFFIKHILEQPEGWPKCCTEIFKQVVKV